MMTENGLKSQLIPGRSYLVTGDTIAAEKILSKFNPIDSIIFDGVESDVKSARQLVTQAQLGAYGSARLIMVKNAHLMSEVVQNTLLKLLEEPPATVIIVLQTKQTQCLLPTVMSRLHSFTADFVASEVAESHFGRSSNDLLNELINLPREALIDLLANEMNFQQKQLLALPSYQISKRVLLLDLAIKKLNANTNLKLTVDWLLLHWEVNSGYTKE